MKGLNTTRIREHIYQAIMYCKGGSLRKYTSYFPVLWKDLKALRTAYEQNFREGVYKDRQGHLQTKPRFNQREDILNGLEISISRILNIY